MFKLETNRLWIVPLSTKQLALFALGDDSLPKSMHLAPVVHEYPERFLKSIRSKIIPALKDPANHPLFSTFWTIIDTASNCMVGDLCFKGNPNELGEVEIGYGTHAEFQNKGFMTEAVGKLVKWALEQENVNCIWAETDPKNMASQKVLTNNNFEQVDATLDNIYWRNMKMA